MNALAAALFTLAWLAAQALAQATAPDAASEWPLAPRACMVRAAHYFRVPLPLLQAVRAQEAGAVGLIQPNVDGSFDYGVMQINSRWLRLLEPVGYTAAVLTNQECANVVAGTWILAREFERAGVWNRAKPEAQAFWRAVGAYHSRDPIRNRAYAEQVWQRYLRFRAAADMTRTRSIP